MEVLDLKCNNCGGDLKISQHIKFFTCTFCKSSLTIKKSGNVAYTEVLERIESNTVSLLKNSENFKVENEIARLDREWVIDSANYGTKNGSKPTSSSTIIGLSIGTVIFMIVMFGLYASFLLRGTSIVPIFILGVFILAFLFAMSYAYYTAKKYETAEKEYKEKRADLLLALSKLKDA